MKYYIGAYYMIKLNSKNHLNSKSLNVYTCSTCINDSYLDSWSIPWSNENKKIMNEAKSKFNLDDEKILNIQHWAGQKFEEKNVGWINTFSNILTLEEYRNTFFPTDTDFQVLSINFYESERSEFLNLFKRDGSFGDIGISINLLEAIEENDSEEFIGFDLIGVEIGGDFHSFHCHDISDDLIQKFGIRINEFGLIQECEDWEAVVNYMNDDKNGFEPVPWFYVKVKKVKM